MSFNRRPVKIFDYIYGILYDLVYRERFNKFLKRNFSSVPIINYEMNKSNLEAFSVSDNMFYVYAAVNSLLRKLYLMQTKVTVQLGIESNTSENMEIGSVRYKYGMLHMNADK